MRCSVVISTYNKSWALHQTLASVRNQKVPFDYEIIVVNDGSNDLTETTCERHGTEYIYLDRPGEMGPSKPMNLGYKRARGDIIFCLNDDVVLQGDDVMERLCELPKREYHVGVAWDLEKDGSCHKTQVPVDGVVPDGCDALPLPRVPLFYMTTIWRKDLYGVGGRDEDFTMLNYEDNWFMDCLVRGRGLEPRYRIDAVGHHLWHERSERWRGDDFLSAKELYLRKNREARESGLWQSSGGPWPYTEST